MHTTVQPSQSPNALIHAQQLHKSFRRKPALRGLSVTVEPGQIVVFVGPDGAGKSTALRIIAGLMRPDSGTVCVLGRDVVRDPEAIRPQLGFMPQGLGLSLSPRLSVEQNIQFFGEIFDVPRELLQQRKEQLLNVTQLRPFRRRLARNLSGGMQQKLALCCTLVHQPKVLILDEPTTGVDPISRREFWTILSNLAATEEIAVLIATSYMDEAERCHHVKFIYDGQILLEGNPVQLRSQHPSGKLEALLISKLAGNGENKTELSAGFAKLSDHFQRGDRGSDGPVVQVQQLTKRFGGFTAVDRVSFDIHPGEIFGFLGPNGAGKTTVIKMLCGILPPTAGSACVAGFDIRHQSRILKTHIGYMSQKFSLYRDLRVIENLQLYRNIYCRDRFGRQNRPALSCQQLLELVDLSGYERYLTADLPVGLRQRLALACAMVHLPQVLFLDEPTSGVDPLARQRFWQIVRFLAREVGTTLLLTTHYMDEAENCDRLALINQARLVAVDTPDQLKEAVEREKGALIEVVVDNFRSAKELIDKHVGRTSLFGRRLHLFSTDVGKDIAAIRQVLAAGGQGEPVVNVGHASLEDAFIHFVQSTQTQVAESAA